MKTNRYPSEAGATVRCSNVLCPLTLTPGPVPGAFRELSSEGRLALSLVPLQLLLGPQAGHTEDRACCEWRGAGSSLPSWRRKSLRSQEMRHGVLPASVFPGGKPRVSVPGGFHAQCKYEKEASEKPLVFWTCSAGPVASRACLLSLFLVIFHLKTATLTLTPRKELARIGLRLRELTVP